MKRDYLIAISVLSIIFCAGYADARDAQSVIRKYQPNSTDIYNIARTNRVHHENQVWMNFTNWGVLGNDPPNSSQSMEDPEYTHTWAPQCEFPGGSGIQYLFMGAPWIGAIVQQGDSSFARVSLGFEGWTGPGNNNYELNPGAIGGTPIEEHGILERSNIPGAVNYLGQNIYSPEAIAHQEFLAVYCDTLTESFWTGSDIIDGPHYPLGLRIAQKTMAWNTIGFDDFILIKYSLQNIGSHDLKNLYMGFYVDADVGWIGEGSWHEDDVCGFLHNYNGQTLNIAYFADNDGRPQDVMWGNNFTCPGVSGTIGLGASQQTYYTNFNWWKANGDPSSDYGPSWTDDGSFEGWTAIYGTPNGDARKYFIMSNREVDFNQWYVSNQSYLQSHPQVFRDPFTGLTSIHTWRPVDVPNAADMANGCDTHYLISYGPFGDNIALPGQPPETHLLPGDSATFCLAYVCGNNFHNPNLPQVPISGGINDPNYSLNPAFYNYNDLTYNCTKAKFLFDHLGQINLPYPPVGFSGLNSVSSNALNLYWNHYNNSLGGGVNVYRRRENQSYPNTPINVSPLIDSVFTDNSLTIGQRYFYRLQGINGDSLKSAFSEEISLVCGAPQPPTGLTASSVGETIVLQWNHSLNWDLDHYSVYRQDSTGTFQSIGTTQPDNEAFTDPNVTPGVEYTYAVTAIDYEGLQSYNSNLISHIMMPFIEPLLVVFNHTTGTFFEWPNNCFIPYYMQLFNDAGVSPDTVNITPFVTPFVPLTTLCNYRAVWIINDTHMGMSNSFSITMTQILSDYIDHGGKVVFSGKRLFQGVFGKNIGWSIVNESTTLDAFLHNYYNIYSTYAAPYYPTYDEFEAASSTLPNFPNLQIDTAKVATLYWPIHQLEFLPEVDGMDLLPDAERLYSFVSGIPDSSQVNGHTVGVRFQSPTTMNYLFTFPLYAMQPYDSVLALVTRVLAEPERETGIKENQSKILPIEFALSQNYPNPFNPTTSIRFDLPQASFVKLTIIDVMGREVATVVNGMRDAGSHSVTFDGSKLASGIYLYSLTAGEFTTTQKMVLIK
jgi:hypothetical protein